MYEPKQQSYSSAEKKSHKQNQGENRIEKEIPKKQKASSTQK